MRNWKSFETRDFRGRLESYFGKLCLSVLFAVVAFAASAQDKAVSGTVIDETGEPVIGATVMVKGTKIGTATDIDGRYSLNTPPTITRWLSAM